DLRIREPWLAPPRIAAKKSPRPRKGMNAYDLRIREPWLVEPSPAAWGLKSLYAVTAGFAPTGANVAAGTKELTSQRLPFRRSWTSNRIGPTRACRRGKSISWIHASFAVEFSTVQPWKRRPAAGKG